MKWIYRALVTAAAISIFISTYLCNINWGPKGSPYLAPIAPFMTSGLYLLGMLMVTENLNYRWRIVIAILSLALAMAYIFI